MMTLTRTRYSPAGIFGVLTWDEVFLAVSLEHSYEGKPKLPLGDYTCVRGKHQLHGMTEPFTTFEVTGVLGHSGILFHCGNTQWDSEGCILVGSAQVGNQITESRKAFSEFMATVGKRASFPLTVRDRA